MDIKLLNILACPLCKGHLLYDKESEELTCQIDQLAFPIKNDIPIMLVEEARVLKL